MDAAAATLIGSWIAAAVSVLTVVVNGRIASRTLRHTTVRDILKVALDLNGPLLFLLEQDKDVGEGTACREAGGVAVTRPHS